MRLDEPDVQYYYFFDEEVPPELHYYFSLDCNYASSYSSWFSMFRMIP